MFSSNKPFFAFDRAQKPLGFVSINCMLKILLVRNNFQVIQSIIGAVKVFVVYFQTAFNTTIKRFPHHSVYPAPSVFPVFAQTCNPISFKQLNFCLPISRIASPSFTQLDRMCCGYTGAQKLSNLFKGSAVFKHLFSFGYFGGVNRFASGNTAHISKIANFVQAFKIQNWFPRFHSLTPFNVNRSIA